MLYSKLKPEYKSNAIRLASEILGCKVKAGKEYGPDGDRYEAIIFPKLRTGDAGVNEKLRKLRDAGFYPDTVLCAVTAMEGKGMSCSSAFVVTPKKTEGTWAELKLQEGDQGKASRGKG